MTGIRIIKIFLASSSELKDDREQFEIFINRKNKEYIKKGIFLELVIWEDFLDAMSATRLQDEYNKAITDCDVFVSLFKTKVGQYTEEEFLKALETFKTNQKPLIYTYFKDSQISISQITDEISSLLNFKKKLGQLGHFYTIYANVDDLKHRFSEQLIKFVPSLAGNLLEIAIDQRSQLDEIEKLKLTSEKGVDYTKLRDLLAAEAWKEADEETARVMLEATNRSGDGWLRASDIDDFTWVDLRTINQLWLHYSDGRFGFSVQKKIYESLGGMREYNEKVWVSFSDCIGWRKRGKWLNFKLLTYGLEAPVGHLPSIALYPNRYTSLKVSAKYIPSMALRNKRRRIIQTKIYLSLFTHKDF